MNAMEWQAGAIERAANLMAYWVETTNEDRLNWCPQTEDASKTRCIKDQIAECIGLNRGLAAALRGDSPASDEDVHAGGKGELDRKSMIRGLASSGKDLAEAVRGYNPADLNKEINLGFGPFPAGALIEIAFGNLWYHGGQINMTQLLYGDTEFRFPSPDYNPLKDA